MIVAALLVQPLMLTFVVVVFEKAHTCSAHKLPLTHV